MRSIFILLFCVCILTGVAQDIDQPDFRSKKDNFTRMREKEIRSDLSSFTIAGIDESMGKQPLKSIPIVNYGNDFMHFQGDDLQVIIKAGRFDPAKHKFGYSDKYLVKIDNKPYYGNYGKVPRNTIEAVTVIAGKDTISLPTAAFSDLYNPNFAYTDAGGSLKSHNSVRLSPDNRKIYIYMLNREPASSYEVTWVIENKKYLRRVVDFGLLK